MQRGILGHVGALDLVGDGRQAIVPAVPDAQHQPVAARLVIAGQAFDAAVCLRCAVLNLRCGSKRLIDGQLQKGAALAGNGVGVAGFAGLGVAVGHQPFCAFLGLQPPLAANLHDEGFGLEFGQQRRHLGANGGPGTQILDQQVGDDFRGWAHAVDLGVGGDARQQVDDGQDARLHQPFAALAAQRVDPVVHVAGDEVT